MRELMGWSLFFCMLFIISGCSGSEKSVPLRVGFNTWPGYEFIYLAKVKGFYEEQNVDVKLVELNALGDVRRAFERGQIDIMASTMVEVLIAAEDTGRSIKIIAVSDASNGSDMMLAEKSITRVSELKGKRIGMEGGTVDVLVAGAALKSAGLSFKDIEVVGKSQDDLVLDLKNGKIDAIQTYPPYTVDLLKSGKYKKVFDTSEIPGQIVDTISVDATVLRDRKRDIKRFLDAYFHAVDYFVLNQVESSEIMGKREGVSGEEFLEAVSGMKIFERDEQSEYLTAGGKGRQVLQMARDALLDTGWLKKTSNVDAFFEDSLQK